MQKQEGGFCVLLFYTERNKRSDPMDKHRVEEAKEAKSVEDLSRMVKKEGITLSISGAEEIYKQLHTEDHELADEELNNVDGGCSSAAELAKQYQRVDPTSVVVNLSGPSVRSTGRTGFGVASIPIGSTAPRMAAAGRSSCSRFMG